jgi:hypothetical protein
MVESFGKELVARLEAGLSVRDHIDVEELELRKTISKVIVGSFVFINLIVLIMISAIYAIDTFLIHSKTLDHDGRLVTSNVLLSIIGATTVQLGAIAIAISYWLFPKKN